MLTGDFFDNIRFTAWSWPPLRVRRNRGKGREGF